MKLIPKNKCRIGMLMVDGRPYHISVINRFIDQINNGVQGVYEKRIYRVSSLQEKEITSRVEHMISRGEVDVVYTIGRACTAYGSAVAKRHNNFPLLFAGVLDPVGEGIVDSLENPGENITGSVFGQAPTEGLINGIRALYPDVEKVFIPYFSATKSGLLESQALELQQQLSAFGMKVSIEPIGRNYDQLMELVEKYRKEVDCFVLLDGCYSSVAQKPMAHIAWEECITQIGCCSSSIDSGAAIAYSGDLNPMAAANYQQLERARLEQIPLGKLPVNVLPNNREFTVNADVMRKIGYSVESLERICNAKGIRTIRRWVAPPQDS